VNFLTRLGLERSRFTVTVMAGLLVFGIALYPNFPKREDPVVVIRTAIPANSEVRHLAERQLSPCVAHFRHRCRDQGYGRGRPG
jgi:hypothetical protein